MAISLPITSTIEELVAFQRAYLAETKLVVYCGGDKLCSLKAPGGATR